MKFAPGRSAGCHDIPVDCARDYLTLTDHSEIMYFTARPLAPDAVRGVRYDDLAFSIDWPARVFAISPAEASWPDFKVTPR